MKLLPVILKRQLTSYARAPSTYLSIAIFPMLSVALGFYISPWLEQNGSDLQVFFQFHPWLYLLLIPALATQLWSDETNAGFYGLMKTMPITLFEWVIGKFIAAWLVAGTSLLLMFPLVIIANYLGKADNSVIASQFLASWLLAGGYLSAGCFICALVCQRTVIFVLTVGLLLTASGLSSLLDALEHQVPIGLADSLVSLSPSWRFSSIDDGKLTLHDLLYFFSMILAFLTATTVTLNYKHS
ncbi:MULTISPECIES: ABC transporter permease [Pseudomonas]|uniref:ABC transport system, membrane protein n=2 Tax=Pseudomonas fluorescens TaxID=294 RepID=C3K640_PSEFS|nr:MULTISPECIES: ABC transporter permease [Pseudomonas]KJZ51874.1 ABC transporter permease [Pseudomonas marginalis]KJZ59306.1 ABC transporter permease [Pseudomonas marginalis]MBZ6458827.1 ABC transporter permease [Pseudomonas fluorescens group sp.]MBZ6465135.1 ABC transporter permease [Pseudomonas fluorescens group sp.]MBZ6471118.1 ABC transporter permease [Pseudomonas fluorescens group sp.]